MSQIGFATSIGLVFEVPILLRSLAESLAEVNFDHLPLGFHPSLLAVLDDGVAPQLTSSLVPSYALDWWRHRSEPAADNIMGIDTLDQCLDHHKQYFTESDSPAAASEAVPVPVPVPAPAPDCQSCINLRGLVNDMLHEACSTLQFVDSCQSSADAALNANVRKAAGLHQLHELALLKELQAEPQALATGSKPPQRAGQSSRRTAVGRKSELVAANAQAELESLKSLPPGSYKWTWGVDITENDVLVANEKNKSRGKRQHSGYGLSLADGAKGRKEWSSTPTVSTVASNACGRPPTVSGNRADEPSPPSPAPAPAPFPDALPDAEPGQPSASFAAMVCQGKDDASSADQPTAFQAAMAWQGEDDVSSDADQPTASQAAMAWQGDNDQSSSSPTGSLTGFDAAPFYLSDSTSSSPAASPPSTDAAETAAFPTASDAADAFLSSSEDSDVEDSIGTSQIENPTPSRVTLPTFNLPIYTHEDFGYVNETWLSSADDMMDTDSE